MSSVAAKLPGRMRRRRQRVGSQPARRGSRQTRPEDRGRQGRRVSHAPESLLQDRALAGTSRTVLNHPDPVDSIVSAGSWRAAVGVVTRRTCCQVLSKSIVLLLNAGWAAQTPAHPVFQLDQTLIRTDLPESAVARTPALFAWPVYLVGQVFTPISL
jgi:hypothetical protein